MASQDHYHIFQWHFFEINRSNFHSYSHGIFLLLAFFALLILITTLFLLAYFCRRRRLKFPTAATTVVTAPPPGTHQWVHFDCTTLSTKSLADSNLEKTECCICLSLFQDDEKLKVLPECQHAYHSECVERWISAQSSCPLCRASLYGNSQGKSTVAS